LEERIDYKKKGKISKRDVLKKLEKHQAGIAKRAEHDPVQAAERQLSTDFVVAMHKLTGSKILDNKNRLKKAIKKRDNRKAKSEKDWNDRKKGIHESMKKRQVKRRKNIAKRHIEKMTKKKKKGRRD